MSLAEARDAVVHCATEQQARRVLAALEERMAEVGLQLHPDKTRIVYCQDMNRRRSDCAETSFTFLGYTFRARQAPTGDGKSMFSAFLPAVGKDALKRMSEETPPGAVLNALCMAQGLRAWGSS
jgi:rhodanese-related sulfurtransferase